MTLLSVEGLAIRFRGPMLLDDVSCQIEAGQRIGLLGRNGAGKTTLLRLLAGQMAPDHGTVRLAAGARLALLPQEVPADLSGSVEQVVASGVRDQVPAETPAWEIEHRAAAMLSRMGLEATADVQTLSSGMKRRVLLARALAADPQLLLLDEPTNHLDIEAIEWLEETLGRWPGTLIFITHDRVFLRKLATRIIEIDRGRLFDWSCDYETFLRRKEEALAAEAKQEALFDKRLAEEEAWIRQGIKARRTRNEGRVRALKAMREQRQERRRGEGTARLALKEADRSGALVVEAKEVDFAYEGHSVVRDLTTTIMRGDRVGIIGPNGVGKTTLLRLLLGDLQPQSGTIRRGTNLQIAYFDQLRDQLDPDKTVQENVGRGNDTVRLGDSTRHILGYLQDFLFPPERARTLVRYLSGGERNRALLARLMTQPANLIVLDEPTNDLDAETLELLEEQLAAFAGTILLVSHDREFLNNVVTSTLVFEAGGRVREYVGGYDDYLRARRETAAAAIATQPSQRGSSPGRGTGGSAATASRPGAAAVAPRKLSFKQQRELAELPQRIESLEAQIAALHQQMAEADFYRQEGEAIAARQAELASFEATLADAYARWEQLEGL